MRKFFTMLCVLAFFVFGAFAQAAALTTVSDQVSLHNTSTDVNHTITFTSPSGINASTDTITITFASSFDCASVDFGDIDLTHGATGTENTETLAASAGVGVWGASFTGDVLTLTAPTDAGASEIAGGDTIIVSIGDHTAGGSDQCENPGTTGSYIIGIAGTFGDSGYLAVPIGDYDIDVSGTVGPGGDANPPEVEILFPNIDQTFLNDGSINIIYTATDDIALIANPISIFYTLNDGLSYIPIAVNVANTGSYLWDDLPNIDTGFVKILVQAEDTSANIGEDLSVNFGIARESSGPGGVREIVGGTGINIPELVEQPDGTFQDDLQQFVYVGELIKSPEWETVYLYNYDLKRYIFPTRPVFDTWYENFDTLRIIDKKYLPPLPLGTNIPVRPGTALVKIVSSPKVYAVEPEGVLRWIPNEEIAEVLYGPTWNQRIMDLPNVFFQDYFIGPDLTSVRHPEGTLIKYRSSEKVYMIQNGKKRHIATEEAFYANRFQWQNIIEISDTYIYEDGPKITVPEVDLLRVYAYRSQ